MTTQLCSMSLMGYAILSSPKLIICCAFLLLEVASSLVSLKFKKLNKVVSWKKNHSSYSVFIFLHECTPLHTKFSLRNLFPFKCSLFGLTHLDFCLTSMLSVSFFHPILVPGSYCHFPLPLIFQQQHEIAAYPFCP